MTFSLTQKPNRKNLLLLFIVAFLVRAAVFQCYVQYNQRYRQPDSMDYHNCAMSMMMGTGMHRPDTFTPIFWRTPGYPLFIAFFYNLFGITSPLFEQNTTAQKAALWTQIAISSIIPLLIFVLIYFLTNILTIAWLTAWIFVFHIGTVLASTYLLTEALSLVFFFPFLIFFYKDWRIYGEKKLGDSSPWIWYTILAALCLGIVAWIRPMGEFVAILTALLTLFLDNRSWKMKLKKIGLFILIFFLMTAPWYARNYRITGKIFFCPMFGPYLNSFCAPKILRDTTSMNLPQSIRYQYKKAKDAAQKDEITAYRCKKRGCKEMSALKVALPVLKQHPWIFARDWIKEVIKTTLDLHSYQLVCFSKNSFMYDPLEEFLTVKWSECIYKQPMPLAMRLLVFLELIFEILKWVGLLLGAWLFLFIPLFKRFNVSEQTKKICFLWIKVVPIIGAIVFMTGGFGYARLRLPIDPLMVMLSLTFWCIYLAKTSLSTQSYGKIKTKK